MVARSVRGWRRSIAWLDPRRLAAPEYPVPSGFHTPENPATLIVRVRSGDPARYIQKLQEITASVDPTMRVEQVMGVVEVEFNPTPRPTGLVRART